MPVRPILEVYVVWHPRDGTLGRQASGAIASHFHTATFSGLAGGAVEVYMRSEGWARSAGPPRPLPITTRYPHGLPGAEFTAIVPVLGTWMARAVRDDPEWSRYVREIFESHGKDGVGVYPLRDPASELGGSELLELSDHVKALSDGSARDATTLCRELAQAVTQSLDRSDGERDRIQVFVSHTKHQSIQELDEDGPRLFDEVRKVISDTRLGHFFDASDMQSGELVQSQIDAELGHGAVLAIRTDRYSGRAWTQHEMLVAKRGDLPIVTLHALRGGEDRGSFLMDHVPSVPCDLDDPAPAILRALNRIVDEALKRSLWRAQSVYIGDGGFDWLPVHAPEPVTLVRWLRGHRDAAGDDPHVWILHPDPPLGPQERDVIVELCALAGFTENVDVLTPRTFAARGGRLR
jgi:hypothetical protein